MSNYKTKYIDQIKTNLKQYALNLYLLNLVHPNRKMNYRIRYELALARFKRLHNNYYDPQDIHKLLLLGLIQPYKEKMSSTYYELTSVGKQFVNEAIPHPIVQILVQRLLMLIFQQVPSFAITDLIFDIEWLFVRDLCHPLHPFGLFTIKESSLNGNVLLFGLIITMMSVIAISSICLLPLLFAFICNTILPVPKRSKHLFKCLDKYSAKSKLVRLLVQNPSSVKHFNNDIGNTVIKSLFGNV